MSEFVVHGVPGSPFMRSVLVALEEKGAPYRIEPLAPGAQRSEAYRRLHPFGRVPAIEHGAVQLYETQAILRYVDAAFPLPALQPHGAEGIGRMNQLIGINDWYLFPQVARVIVFNRIVGPVLLGTTPNEEAIAAAVPDARLCLGEIDRLLGDNEYLAGAEFSLADVLLAPQIYYLGLTPEGRSILEGTRLAAWLERMNARPSMIATLPPEPLRKAA
ncbi:MAG TPA: glutathione S-transferase family protein [Gammaproteobacteria bacterium]|nr:glutathione S-transferase family protein [Gammaproteobacteria bacterium]